MSYVAEGPAQIFYRAKDLTPTGRVRGGKDRTKPVATVQYLRGPSAGAHEIVLAGMKPGYSIRVLPQDGMSGRARHGFITRGVEHMATTPRLWRLNSDDKAMWLIGFLWAKGVTEVGIHVDPGHRA